MAHTHQRRDQIQKSKSVLATLDRAFLQVQTDFTPVSETQFLATIESAESINHVVVFLTGAAALPAGAVGTVYWSWPDPLAPPNWQPLGHISNAKPSAIFKISNLKKLHELTGELLLLANFVFSYRKKYTYSVIVGLVLSGSCCNNRNCVWYGPIRIFVSVMSIMVISVSVTSSGSNVCDLKVSKPYQIPDANTFFRKRPV